MKLQVWHVKLTHMVFFFLLTACIIYVLIAGVLNRITPWTWGAIAVLLVEVLVLTFFRGRCPFTILAERLGAANGRVSDIFLPRWISDRVLTIYGILLAIGCALVGVRVFLQ